MSEIQTWMIQTMIPWLAWMSGFTLFATVLSESKKIFQRVMLGMGVFWLIVIGFVVNN